MLHVPPVKLERNTRVSIATSDQNGETKTSLQHLYNAVANAKFPKKWGKVDRSAVYYRTGTWKEAPHFGLSDDNAFKSFLEDLSNQREGSEVQLVVYTKQRAATPVSIQPLQLSSNNDVTMTSPNIPLAPLTPRKSPPRLQQIPTIDFSSGPESATPSPTFIQLKSVTIRSSNRIYKQNIAVSDKTTFASLLSFAIRKPPPPGKQFVLQSADGELEYMPEDPVRKVIHGTIHADVIVKMEDVREVDFTQF